MTTYVSPFPFAPDAYHLWADDPDEALCAAYACGASLADHRPDRSPLHFTVTAAQFAEAVAQGAQMTDLQGPHMAAAVYLGNTTAVQSIREWRALTAASTSA